jgi:nitrogen PTS system EIIA component
MGVSEILTPEHVSVSGEAEGLVATKREAIHRLSVLLALPGPGAQPTAGSRAGGDGHPTAGPRTGGDEARRPGLVSVEEIERVLEERERLQSTGVGGGVAIPHGSLDRLERTLGAVLLCPKPIAFDAIDGAPVSILFAVVGPRRAAGEHLKTLARVSKLLRDDRFRQRLVSASTGREAFALIAAEEGRGSAP